MDWSLDLVGLNEEDLGRVYKYAPKKTTVIRMLNGDKRPKLMILDDDEWEGNLQEIAPSPDTSESGLVMIIAERTRQNEILCNEKTYPDKWLKQADRNMPFTWACTEKSLDSKTATEQSTICSIKSSIKGQRDTRVLPFSRGTFETITKGFWTHNSISRVINRADMPIFSVAEVKMTDPRGGSHSVYVYNYKTTNAWDMDLAFTATFFPQSGLTYAILFGCPSSVKDDIVRRLNNMMEEVAHPLVVPSMLAEIERSRHVDKVSETIAELETRISELDLSPSQSGMANPDAERRNQLKREAWLDTGYLRNQLITWTKQLVKMAQHADELRDMVFTHRFQPTQGFPAYAETIGNAQFTGKGPQTVKKHESVRAHVRRTGYKIRNRIQDMIEEYDEKIRDCTMRIEGMAMATQWAQGETNVEIALATSRDSRHMRSIAILSMIFLPGTAIASLFSTTLFEWNSPEGGVVVSRYLWIYFAVTACFTLLTVGSWYYFSLYRPSKNRELV
ncbi:hypothetical protein F5X99DRAFT_375787 [Biscogniauxia marginata]|nr:hypothetical protein F5X99DRAFT_375787 [Biscogniauxia marginata]